MFAGSPLGTTMRSRATLGELARERARRMIAAALEAEVEQSSACFALSDADRELVFAQRGAASFADLPSFHDIFAARLGFPSFYGRNMAARVDCLTYRDGADGMAAIVVPPGDVLTLQLDDGRVFAKRCPEQYAALIESAASSTGDVSRWTTGRSSPCLFADRGCLLRPLASGRLVPVWTTSSRFAWSATTMTVRAAPGRRRHQRRNQAARSASLLRRA